jgi:intracellular sulfur oxidation DsrE/DsrF family protein
MGGIDMKRRLSVLVTALFCLLVLNLPLAKAAAVIDDSNALKGVQTTKALFDISLGDAESLELYLEVIQQTHDDLIRQGQKPDFVIVFRGSSVRLINSETWSYSEEDQERLKKSSAMLAKLKGEGANIEACSIATKLFKVDNATILPDIRVVSNTFVSLIGYQEQGYRLVTIK